ncbi:MAG: YebC/PmpR family DNA-binding transcriptional regulator [Ignavibacteriales bacterium CG07_land_8_20_14_0_80_59_12]|nr:MAG: YebC/PmpR family DNA-binding transcriptional regulator [Ignavibacteriales bacterium CG07_land_8_20_14_0_80_59_12]
MSGHSKWAKIKHGKAVTDAKRGRVFTRLIKEITVAARSGGGDPAGNPRLRLVIQSAKANNMPAENITRAVKRGTGELPGVSYEEVTYEGYAPGGVALLIEAVTDSRNRTVSELRHLLSRNNGSLSEAGSVAWMFHKKGTIVVPKAGYSEDDILSIVLDAGADDMQSDGESFEIITSPHNFEPVKKALEGKGVKVENAGLEMVPQNTVRVEGKEAEQVLKLIESLEDHEDVQHVYANFDIDEKVMASFGG